MNLKSFAAIALALAAVGATTTDALAWGESGKKSGSVSYSGGTFTGSASGGTFTGSSDDGSTASGTYTGDVTGGFFGGTYTVSAAEPFSALAIGLGLLGARFLRRRQP